MLPSENIGAEDVILFAARQCAEFFGALGVIAEATAPEEFAGGSIGGQPVQGDGHDNMKTAGPPTGDDQALVA